MSDDNLSVFTLASGAEDVLLHRFGLPLARNSE
jgi:hypothetical protein